MKISVDTKEDSHDDIRKVIAMLQHIIGEKAETNQPNVFEASQPEVPANVMSMFSENAEPDLKELLSKAEEAKKEQSGDKVQLEEYF